MELNTTNKNDVNSNFSSDLNIFLENHLEGDTFTIDKIVNSVAACENRRTKQIINIHISKLPINIKENDIIKYINGTYVLEENETQNAKENIKSKFDALRKK